ncbi:hypothetical protein [Coleofasciculus sp.]|uniref:hypothetical protein n=1 Tax=Coleofasciculus sp. TaxID=3100458 RepID=UPI003A43B458
MTDAKSNKGTENQPQNQQLPQNEEAQPTHPHPPEPELVETAKQSAETKSPKEIPVEEIAPESQLSPLAEPIGEGDPKSRTSPGEVSPGSENPPQ